MKRLIVNADDFGLTVGVNRAIIEAHQAGAVSSTTLMVNAAAAADAAARAGQNPALGVGLHLNLTSGPPALPPSQVSSLVNSEGSFPGLAGAVWRLSAGIARRGELEAEIEAQLLRAHELGLSPTHIDSHHHLHAHPRLRGAIGRVAPRLGVTRMRGYHLRPRSPKSLAIALAAALPAGAGRLRTPDRFSGIETMGRRSFKEQLAAELAAPGEVLEFMCHPGHFDVELARVSSFAAPREHELAALLEPGFRAAIEAAGARLIAFGEL